MTDYQRCTVRVKREPKILLANNPEKRDFAYIQQCGAPAVQDGMCAAHLALRERHGESRWDRVQHELVR